MPHCSVARSLSALCSHCVFVCVCLPAGLSMRRRHRCIHTLHCGIHSFKVLLMHFYDFEAIGAIEKLEESKKQRRRRRMMLVLKAKTSGFATESFGFGVIKYIYQFVFNSLGVFLLLFFLCVAAL